MVRILLHILSTVLLVSVTNCGPEDRFKDACKVTDEFTDDTIGTIKLEKDLYCQKESFTSRVGVTCCHPTSPKELGLKWILHCKNHPDGKEIEWNKDKPFEEKSKVWFLIHGWLEDPTAWPNKMAEEILKMDPDAEVIVVDWSVKPLKEGWFYMQSAADLRTMGAMVGSSILRWKIEEKTVIVGMSMGAQVIGEAGRWVDTKGSGKKIEHCIGLDPAQPLFDFGHKNRR